MEARKIGAMALVATSVGGVVLPPAAAGAQSDPAADKTYTAADGGFCVRNTQGNCLSDQDLWTVFVSLLAVALRGTTTYTV